VRSTRAPDAAQPAATPTLVFCFSTFAEARNRLVERAEQAAENVSIFQLRLALS
jgi:hypothetical protein